MKRPQDFVPDAVLDTLFKRLPRQALQERLEAAQALARLRGFRYLDDRGRARTIDLSLRPWLVTSTQLRFFSDAIRLLAGALHQVAALYRARADVRAVLRVSEEQAEWLRLQPILPDGPLGVMGRMDSTASFGRAGWQTDFRMLEPNAVGVGGVHYAPVGCRIVMDVMDDLLRRALPGARISPTADPRQMLLGELTLVAQRLGSPLRRIALIENTDFTTGTDEFGELARYFQDLGLDAVVADPRALQLRGGRVLAEGKPVDLLYRDSELSEFIEMEQQGKPLKAARAAVQQGRLVSSLVWELDQKSAWEIFTDERFARFFSPVHRRFFRSHLLWTRLLRDRQVMTSRGRIVDLLPYARKSRAQLVIKPNSLFGGEGVIIGRETPQREWERELDKALKGKEDYVVQEVAAISRETKRAVVQPRSTVSGFFFTSGGVGLVGRFSGRTVVNVSQGGGLIPALWVR
jgi:hypothetical protein